MKEHRKSFEPIKSMVNRKVQLNDKKVAFKFTIALTFFIIVRELNLSNRRMEDEYPRVSR